VNVLAFDTEKYNSEAYKELLIELKEEISDVEEKIEIEKKKIAKLLASHRVAEFALTKIKSGDETDRNKFRERMNFLTYSEEMQKCSNKIEKYRNDKYTELIKATIIELERTIGEENY